MYDTWTLEAHKARGSNAANLDGLIAMFEDWSMSIALSYLKTLRGKKVLIGTIEFASFCRNHTKCGENQIALCSHHLTPRICCSYSCCFFQTLKKCMA